MSLESWKAEFYFTDAFEVPVEEALAHSLRKWIGLRPENLARHDLKTFGSSVYDGDRKFWIDDSSCALCFHYLRSIPSCSTCPLAKSLGRRCDHPTSDAESPYRVWVSTKNPEPMIEALQTALASEVSIGTTISSPSAREDSLEGKS